MRAARRACESAQPPPSARAPPSPLRRPRRPENVGGTSRRRRGRSGTAAGSSRSALALSWFSSCLHARRGGPCYGETLRTQSVGSQGRLVEIPATNGFQRLGFGEDARTTMTRVHELVFGPFVLDPAHKQLWRDGQRVALQPQPLAVLHQLVLHAGRVVPSEDLLRHACSTN